MLLLLLTLAAPVACADALAELLPRLHKPVVMSQPSTGAIDVGDSHLVSRTVTGVSLPLHLKAASHSLGTARLIGGMDSSAVDGAVVGGLAWQAGGQEGMGAGLDVLRTGLPAVAGGGLLTQASLQLPVPFLKSTPSFRLALGSYIDDADHDGAAAGRLSFAADALGGRYSVSYAQAQSGFRPLGSQLTANQANLDLNVHYTLDRYQLNQQLRFRRMRPGQPGEIRTWRSDTFWSGPAGGVFLPLMATFRLHAGLRFKRRMGRHPSNAGWLLEARGESLYWQMWRLDTSLELGRTAAFTSVDHASLRLGGTRSIRLGDFVGNVATHFRMKLRSVTSTHWQFRSSLRLSMRHSAQQVSFGIRWITHEWHGNAREGPAWRVMFRYSIAAAEALPGLVSAIGQLVP